ncbi:hypothetical protein TYRP_003346 [Tyrophagus putrescentiae]|nr:hypothetical protein TYRP_003346 [Tyrophagus putrescentiae]
MKSSIKKRLFAIRVLVAGVLLSFDLPPPMIDPFIRFNLDVGALDRYFALIIWPMYCFMPNLDYVFRQKLPKTAAIGMIRDLSFGGILTESTADFT